MASEKKPKGAKPAPKRPRPGQRKAAPPPPPPSTNGRAREVLDGLVSKPPGPRPASQYRRRQLDWFWHPYVALSTLTLLVGHTGTGKSTLAAHLIAMAKRPLLLPGFEEDFESLMLPRLEAADGADDDLGILDEGTWHLPGCKNRLIQAAQDWKADLILFDPISSYLCEGKGESDPEHIRDALEAAASIASACRCAVVGIRHPGKAADNVMVGSREWANVPTQIIELLLEASDPVRRVIRLWKDRCGTRARPRTFDLVGEAEEPLLFSMGQEIDRGSVDAMNGVTDPMDRSQLAEAQLLLKGLLEAGEMEKKTILALADGERISARTMERAAKLLGVVSRREGQGSDHKGYWSMQAVKPQVVSSVEPPEGGG